MAARVRYILGPLSAAAAATSGLQSRSDNAKCRPFAKTVRCEPSKAPPPKVMTQTSKGYLAVDIAGTPYPPFARAPIIADLMGNFVPRGGSSGDIFIATFPKCGTTWMQQIVLLLLAGGDAETVRDPMKLSPWIEATCSRHGTIEEFEKWSPAPESQMVSPARRVIKTHAPEHLAPWNGGSDAIPAGAKVIVVVRNPKDAAVSLFHHTMDGGATFGYHGDWDHFVKELFMPGLAEHGCFWKWHADWWKASQKNESILWISFEEIKADPQAAIQRIADFCGIDAKPEVVQRVAAGSSFSAMKKQFAEEDAKKASRGEKVKKNHIRQGKSGAWSKTFTSEQETMFDAYHERKCEETGMPSQLLFQYLDAAR